MPYLSYSVLITFVYYVITLTPRLPLCCFTSLIVKDYLFVHALSICQRLPLVCQSVKDYLFVHALSICQRLPLVCQRLPLCCFTSLIVKDYLFVHALSICQRLQLVCQSIKDYLSVVLPH